MLILTSPAKTLDLATPYQVDSVSQPQFLKEAAAVHDKLVKLNKAQVATLMGLSDNLTELNFERFQNWTRKHQEPKSRPAIYLYNGDIYRELNPKSYTSPQQAYAQNSLRIITGYYGILRPYDLTQPYRLEMKTPLKVDGQSLADYWRPKLTAALNHDIEQQNHKLVLNLASKEYAKAIDFNQLNAQVLKVDFKEKRNGKLKIIAIYAKKARGMMIEYCIKNQVTTLEELKSFNVGGYQFKTEENNVILFVR